MIAVVGGGISGLATAWYLSRGGQPCTLIEKSPRLGGVIETGGWEGCVLEGGPDSFLAAKPEAAQLASELGLEAELISSNDHQRVTYIWKHRRLVEIPDGLMMMIPTRIAPMLLTPLFGWGTKLRMGLDLLRRPREGAAPVERSVADFVSGHYGHEMVDYLADPLLSGVYGGTAEALSVDAVLTRFVDLERKYGSLTRGALAARKRMPPSEGSLFRTLKRGLGSLVEELERQLQPSLRRITGEVSWLERTAQGWQLRVNGEWVEAAQVILAVPAYAAGALVRSIDAESARLLESVDYSSSATVALVYRPGRLPRPIKGFGALIPRVERRLLRALTVVQNKFPHRAPEGYNVLRCFLGGAGREPILDQSDEVIRDSVLWELRMILGIIEPPDYFRVVRWRRAMTQYTLGHNYRVGQAQERLRRKPGLHLAGNAYQGIGIPDCIRTGKQAAEAVLRAVPVTR